MIHEHDGKAIVISKIAIVYHVVRRDPSIGWSYTIQFQDHRLYQDLIFKNEQDAKFDRNCLISKIYRGQE